MRRINNRSAHRFLDGPLPRIAATVCLLVLLFLGACCNAFGAGGDIIWQSADSQPGKQQATAMAADSQGNLIVTGYQNLNGDTNDNYYTVKFKADGSGVAWRAAYDKAGGSDQATAVAADANNDVIVTGFVWNGTNSDIHTIKYRGSDGAVLWQHTYTPASNNGNDAALSIAVDSLDNVYVGGYTQNGAGNDDYLVLKYGPDGPTPDGTPAWQVTYDGPAGGRDRVSSVFTGAGGIAITGQSWNGSAFDMLTLMYDYNGNKLWEKRYPSAGGASGKQVRIDGGGNVVVTGYAANAANKDIYTAKYDGVSGNVIWQRTFDGGYDDEANGLYVDAAGNVYITGYTWTLSGFENFYTARYASADGALVWQQTFDSGGGNTDMGMSIAVDEAGDVYVSGYTYAAGGYDFRTIKYKRDSGTMLWQRSFNGSDSLNDRPAGLALSPAGEVLVAGWSESTINGLDYIVVKYDQGALNPPSGLTATTTSTTAVQLAWTDNSANEEGFRIERKLGDSGVYAQIATVGPNSTTYSDTGLVANNYYYYRVKAYNAANGDSHYSNEAHALTVYFTSITPAWTYIFDSPDARDDFATSVAVGPDNNPVVTGYSLRTVGGFDYFTVKLGRADKSVTWSALYDDPDSEMDIAKGVAVDTNNNAVVTGYASLYYAPALKNINSIYTMNYPATGLPEAWHAQYNGPGAIDDRATAIATTTDSANNVVVIGYGKNAAGNNDIYVVKYNADGTKAWSIIPYDGQYHGNDYPSAVATGPDGSVYVTGYSEKTPNSGVYNLFTAKYSAISGTMVWSDIYSVNTGGDNRGNSIAVDGAGDVYVTGSTTNGAGNRDIYTIKYSGSSPAAQRLWERAVDGPAHGDDEGVSVRVDPIDGAIVVAGTILTGAANHDFSVLRYSPAGGLLWQKNLQRPDNDDDLTAMAIDASGYVYVAGNTGNGASEDVLAAIYDSEGTMLGMTVYNGAANGFDEASAIAANKLGEAFIAGYTTNGSNNADYLVLKLTNSYILVPAPFSVTAQADYSKLNLAWGNNTPGTGFRIERTLGPVTSGSVWTLINTASPGTAGYQDSGLNANTNYCYRIEAFSGSLATRKIVSCATTTIAPPSLNPLSLVSATAIDISWNTIAGNTGYKLERSTDNATWSQLGANLPANTVTFHDTGLNAGTVYYYRISSISAAGTSLASAVQMAPVLNPPTGITSARVDLSWPAVSGISGYKLERSTDNLAWTQIAAPAQGTTSYSDTAVAVATTYYYRLKAVTTAGVSAPSLVRSATTILPTPTLNSATAASTSQINLSWSDVSGENGFTVWEQSCSYDGTTSDISYCQNSYPWAWGSWTQVAATGQGVTSYSRIGRNSGYAYQYSVVATTSGGITSPSSNARLAWTIPAAPVLNPLTASDTSVSLSWSDVNGDNGYTVERKTGSGGSYSVLNTLGQNSASYTDTTAAPQTTYYYRLKATGLAGASAYSNEQSVTTMSSGPAVTSVTATSTVTVNWNAIGGAGSYDVQRSNYSCSRPDLIGNGGFAYLWTSWASVGSSATNSYTDSAVTPGCSYKYSVRANVSGTYTAPGSDGGLYAQVTPAAAAITTIAASSTNPPRLVVNWNTSAGAKYSLEWKLNSSGTWSNTPISLFNTTSYTHTPAPTAFGTTYDYRITASTYDLSRSAATSPVVSQTTVLAPPASPAAAPSGAYINLTWATVTGNNGYKVERSPNGASSWAQIATPATGATSYLDNSVLLPGVTYYYRISTKDAQSNYSAPSSTVNATTTGLGVPVLDPLSGITATSMTLTWSDMPGNNGYKVERSLDNSVWTQIATPAPGATSYTGSGLSAGTLYYFRVSTHGTSTYSAPSNVQSATTTPAAPASVAANVTSEARIDLSWQVTVGAANYKIQRSIGPGGPWNEIANLPIAYATLYCGYYTSASLSCTTLIPAYAAYSDTGLTEDTQYCYQIAAWNATGGDSAPSTAVCRKTPAVGGPSLTAVTALNSRLVKLEWSYNPTTCAPNPCDAPDGFEIWRQAWNGQWVLWSKAAATATTFTDRTSIEPLKTYNYKIRAYKGSDTSVFSTVKGASTPAYSSVDGSCLP